MLEKPDLGDEAILSGLQHAYGLRAAQIAFLPLGVDVNAAVYRVVADDGTPYFLKLRRGVFDAASVSLPRFLSDQGMAQIIAPVATQTGQLWGALGAFTAILYPFVEGRNGYEVSLSDQHWSDLGLALKGLHAAKVPPALLSRLRPETYAPQWRESVKAFLARVMTETWEDAVAVETAAFLQAKRGEILDLVQRTDQLARVLLAQPRAWVVCHADLHAGNILIDAHAALYIVDWDNPILAPKERDLMFIGGGLMGGWRPPLEEAALFYRSYGPTEIDPSALAYYRYERIIEDLAAYCEQLLSTNAGGDDRRQAFHYLTSNFLSNATLDIAYQSDQTRTNATFTA